MESLIQHFMRQNGRFSYIFAHKNATAENAAQFGLNLGGLISWCGILTPSRMIYDFIENSLPENFYRRLFINTLDYSYINAMHTLNAGIGSNATPKVCELIEFGFALGFLMQELNKKDPKQDHVKWWRPLTPHLCSGNWTEINRITKENLASIAPPRQQVLPIKVFDNQASSILIGTNWQTIHQQITRMNEKIFDMKTWDPTALDFPEKADVV